MTAVETIHVDGTWQAAASGAQREVLDPADAKTLAVVAEGGVEDTDAAVAAARRAFDQGPWPGTPVAERAALLRRVAELLQRDRETIALIESRDTGKTLEEGRVDVDDVTNAFRYFADLAAGESAGRVIDAGTPDVHSVVVHEPVGVCAMITPWNYPLLQASWEIAPALAAGNTFVIKPSEVTPLSTVHLVRGRGRAAGRGGQPGHRHGRPRRRPAVRAPRCGPGLLHRRADQRHQGRAGRRADGQEGRAGARRQEPQCGLRRCLRHCRGL
ncbi:NAD/NADP-dependent betaine aldehyde dehydrogenase [Streptomyces antimycoticus]